MKSITIKPTPKQHQAYEALKEKEFVFLGGGAGGGKSWLICESRLINALRYPGYKSFIGREELKRLMQSTYITWTKVCKYHQIPDGLWKLNGQYNYIELYNGSRIDLLDLKYLPSDPLYERFGSLEYSDGAIEEAGEVEFLAYDVLKSRKGRHLNKEYGIKPTMLITGNPKKNWTYREFYKPWKNKTLPDNYAFIQSLYQDNPYTAEDYGKQLSQIKDKVTKQRLMFGNWEYEDDPNALMAYDNIVDIFTNTVEKKEEDQKYLISDIARYGRDKTVVMIWLGLKLLKIIILPKAAIDQTAELIRDIIQKERIPYSHCLIDEVGVGGGVVDILRGVKGFIANASPLANASASPFLRPDYDFEKDRKNWENYGSLKDQCAYMLAEHVMGHKIAAECNDDKIKEELIEELEQIKSTNIDSEQKLRIIPKDEVKELIGRSPDLSDCLLMRMYFELRKVSSGSGLPTRKKSFK